MKNLLATAAVLLPTATVASAAVQSVVLMSNLNEPRDVALAPNGDLYVIEAGVGFDTTGMTPMTTDTGPAYFGTTGSIALLSGGVMSRPVIDLPMLYNPTSHEITGGHGIAATSAGLTYSIGLGSTVANRSLGPAGALALGTLNMQNPAGQVDLSGAVAGSTNPFHLAVAGSRTVVADAGDNSVFSVENGIPTLVGYLPDTSGGAQFVPTGVAFAENGEIYVGGLSGFPFAQGSASIYLMNGGTPTMFATGFTNIIDIATGPDGNLFVLEYATNGILSGDATGGLWALSADGQSRELLMSSGLVHPTGLAAGPNGILYVTHNGAAGELLAVTIPETGSVSLAALAVVFLMGQRRRNR